MAQTKHQGCFYRNGLTCSQSPTSPSTHLGAKKKDASTSSNVNSEALMFHEPLASLLSPSSLSSLARPSCPTVQRGCFGDCGPKLPSQGSHSKGFGGLEGGIRPHCRMFSKLRKGKQGQEEERKASAFPNAIQRVDYHMLHDFMRQVHSDLPRE